MVCSCQFLRQQFVCVTIWGNLRTDPDKSLACILPKLCYDRSRGVAKILILLKKTNNGPIV